MTQRPQPTLDEIADKVWVWIQPGGESGVSNAGVIDDEDGLTVVDTLMVQSQWGPFASAVKRLGRPVKRVVLTHAHIDHVGGTTAFRNAMVLGSPMTSALLDQPMPVDAYKAFMPAFAEGFDELAVLGTRPVSHLVDEAAQLTTRIEILPARGHTDGDLMVLVADCDVLFAGDLCFFGVTPLAFQGDPAAWADVLGVLGELAADHRPGARSDRRRRRGERAPRLPAPLRRGIDPAGPLGRLARAGRARPDQHREGRHAPRRRRRHAPQHAQGHRSRLTPIARPDPRPFSHTSCTPERAERAPEWRPRGWSHPSRTVGRVDHRIDEITARQHGLLTRRQALELGMTRSSIAHRLDRGRWIGVNRYVFRLAGTPCTDRSTVMATVLSAGPDAVATGITALSLHGVRGFDLLPPHVVVARRPPRWAAPGVVETSLLPAGHRALVDGIPTATAARALFDLAASVTPRRLARVTDTVLAARRTTPSEMRTVLDDLAISGRAGTRALRAVLADRPDGYVPTTTELEARFVQLIEDTELERPARQVSLGGSLEWIGRVDFLWRDQRVVVETDGGEHHASISDRSEDERRDRALEAAGWIVLRFSWTDVTRRPTSVIRTLRHALLAAA